MHADRRGGADLQRPRRREPARRRGVDRRGLRAAEIGARRMAARDLPSAYAHAATLSARRRPRPLLRRALRAGRTSGPHLHALYAFSLEIARVRDSVSEALPGEIRLQWWRDALQGEARGDVMANPVAAALDDTVVRFRLPRQALVNLIDARVGDLYDDPIPTLNDLEGYCGETSSTLIRLASLILADGRRPGLARRRRPCRRRLRRHRPAPRLSLTTCGAGGLDPAAERARPARRGARRSSGRAAEPGSGPGARRDARRGAPPPRQARAASARRSRRRSSRLSCRSPSWTATCGRWSGATTTRSGR